MQDAISLLKERLERAEAKASRAEKAWESAKKEAVDLATAYRVMRELSGESSSGTISTGDRQATILDLLRVGEEMGQSPAELFERYRRASAEEISIDTFRTTIWRMKDNAYLEGSGLWVVRGDSGSYWKEPASWNARESAKASASQTLESAEIDDDDDSPF
jgi:hypothetical protein